VLEILNRLLVLLRGSSRLECAEILSLSRLRIFLSRVQPVFACLQLSDHVILGESGSERMNKNCAAGSSGDGAAAPRNYQLPTRIESKLGAIAGSRFHSFDARAN
jgi:hypothetical protein